MFTEVINSSDVQSHRGSSSQSSAGTSRRHRCTEQDVVIENLHDQMRAHHKFMRQQQEDFAKVQEYHAQ
jgi:hypothetical protein